MDKRLKFARKGKDLLKIKREQLLYNIDFYWKEYLTLKNKFYELWFKAFRNMDLTYKGMGKNYLFLICNLSKLQYSFNIKISHIKNIGLIIPKIEFEFNQDKKLPPYAFENTTYHLDDLIETLKLIMENIMKLAEIEDLMIKFGHDLKKLNRRINALENKIVPEFEYDIKRIKNILEENERESFSRLKKIKELINQKVTEQSVK